MPGAAASDLAREASSGPNAARCFPSLPSLPGLAIAPVRLAARHAQALAELLPLLGCGEEAAAMAFDGLAARDADPVAVAALRRVANEEREHDARITALAAALPQPRRAPALVRDVAAMPAGLLRP